MSRHSANRHSFSLQFQVGSVDFAQGIVHGVAVATMGEAKGHDLHLDSTSLSQLKLAGEKYTNGVKVKCDHGSGVMSTIGFLKDFGMDGQTLRANLYVFDTEPTRDKLLEMCQKVPDTFGLSVSFSGKDERKDGKTLARCSELYSVDIVPEAAANPTGMFSLKEDEDNTLMELSRNIELHRLSLEIQAHWHNFENPNHDEKGQFASGNSGAASHIVAAISASDKANKSGTSRDHSVAATAHAVAASKTSGDLSTFHAGEARKHGYEAIKAHAAETGSKTMTLSGNSKPVISN